MDTGKFEASSAPAEGVMHGPYPGEGMYDQYNGHRAAIHEGLMSGRITLADYGVLQPGLKQLYTDAQSAELTELWRNSPYGTMGADVEEFVPSIFADFSPFEENISRSPGDDTERDT